MGKVVVTQFMSLDGVVQAPGGPKEDTDGGFRHGGWSHRFFDPQVMGGAWNELAERCTALLQGRRTYEVSAGAWPRQSGDPFADWINSVPKYVVSDSLSESDVTWAPTTIVRGADLEREVSALREQSGDIAMLGSSSVVRVLMAADLVDELSLMIEPVTLGGGKTIFPDDGEARIFELTSVTTTGTGVHVCRYERAR